MVFYRADSIISCGVYQIGQILDYDCGKGICKVASDRAHVLAELAKARNEEYTKWNRDPVSAADKALETFKGQLKRRYQYVFPAMYVFSDAVNYGNGARLAKFIQDNNLGKVIESDECMNHNSGHQIKTWIWQVDKEATRDFVNTNMPKFSNSDLFGAAEYKQS